LIDFAYPIICRLIKTIQGGAGLRNHPQHSRRYNTATPPRVVLFSLHFSDFSLEVDVDQDSGGMKYFPRLGQFHWLYSHKGVIFRAQNPMAQINGLAPEQTIFALWGTSGQ